MTLPEVAFASIVLLVGIPAAVRFVRWRPRVRNLTAFALVLSWCFGQGIWLVTGNNLPISAYVIADIFVLAAIFCKADWQQYWPYEGWKAQLLALWYERSPWDRAVIAIFPVMWCVYALPLGEWTKWALLWWLSAAQFFFAGGEAIHLVGLSANKSCVETPGGSPGSEFRAWRLVRHGW